MHDGGLTDLKQVLDLYIGAGNSHPSLDQEIHTLVFLTGKERRDLLAFLNSLNGQMPKMWTFLRRPFPTARRSNMPFLSGGEFTRLPNVKTTRKKAWKDGYFEIYRINLALHAVQVHPKGS
jgi:hypothetical protein